MSARDILAALAVAIVWGLNFIAIKVGVGETTPIMLAGLRFLFAAIPMIFFIAPPKAPAWAVVLYGLLIGTGQFSALFIAMGRGFPVGLAALIIQAQVFFTILLARIFLSERPRRVQLLGTILGFVGMAVIGSERLAGANVGPFLLVVLSAAFWAAGNLLAKSLRKPPDMLAFTVWASLAAAPPLFLLSFAVDGPGVFAGLAHPSFKLIVATFSNSYASTVFAFAVWAWLLTRHPAASVAPFALLVPIIGAIGGAIVFGEKLTPLEFAGGALVMLGLVLSVFGGRRASRSSGAAVVTSAPESG